MFCKRVLEKKLGNFFVRKNTQTGDFSYYYLDSYGDKIILEDWNQKSHKLIREKFICDRKNLGNIRKKLGNIATLYLNFVNNIGSLGLKLTGNCIQESQLDKQIENREYGMESKIRQIKLGNHVIQKNKDESISYYLTDRKGELDYVSSWYPGNFNKALQAAQSRDENKIIIMIFKLSNLFEIPVEKLLDFFG